MKATLAITEYLMKIFIFLTLFVPFGVTGLVEPFPATNNKQPKKQKGVVLNECLGV